MTECGLSVTIGQLAPIPLDVKLTCAAGEMLALVGPSGSGKSTILRAIAGLYRVTSGFISCNDATWLDTGSRINLDPQSRRIGFVVQNFALFPHLTALENIMESLAERPYPERERRARDLVARMHLAGLEQRRPGALSGGQQQRVAVARALAREPNVLLLDEPFGAVDRATRERLYRELAELRRELAIPVILVTHDFDEALLLADKMCILSQGKILQTGIPYEVMTRPDSVQVAHLVGLKNVFRAGVIEHFPEQNLTVIEWRGRRIGTRLQSEFPPAAQVTWTIPQGYVVLHGREQPSAGELENLVSGVVASLVRLGDNTVCSIYIDDPDRPPLFLSVPTHAALRDGIETGGEVTVSLLGEGIHLMPPDKSLTADLIMTL